MSQIKGFEHILYGAMILIGLVSCLYGFKLFKFLLTFVIAVVLAVLGGYAGYLYGSDPIIWSVFGGVAGGLAGLILGLFFYSIGVATAGGVAASLYVLPFIDGNSLTIQIMVIVVVSGVASLLSVFLTTVTLQLAMALLGALFIVHGANYFVNGTTIHQPIEGGEGYAISLDLSNTLSLVIGAVALLAFFIQRSREKKS